MHFYDGNGNVITLENAASSGVTPKVPWSTVIHRGWVSGVKENTLPAFFLAKENGYDWAECDVRFSADGVPVLAHNTTIVSEDGSVTLVVADSTLAALQSITLQTHQRFGKIMMPTLAELLDMARLIDLNILIDLKYHPADDMAALAQIVLASGWSDHVVYMPTSADRAAAIAAVDRNASFDIVSSVGDVASLPNLAPYQALLTGANTVGFDFNASSVGDGFDAVLDTVRAAGLSVSYWNVTSGNCAALMDSGPLRITKHNNADSIDLDALYLAEKSFW